MRGLSGGGEEGEEEEAHRRPAAAMEARRREEAAAEEWLVRGVEGLGFRKLERMEGGINARQGELRLRCRWLCPLPPSSSSSPPCFLSLLADTRMNNRVVCNV
eukprot:3916653-Rhodomonas_salina.2